MLFNSFSFLVFFPVVTAGYFLLPFRLRWAWLLAASCYFYMCFIPIYILILFFTIAVDYIAGLAIEKSQGVQRRLVLIVSIVANVGVLAFFKYFNFFNENIAALASVMGWNYSIAALKIILPIGLSFHTFQSLSYTIEVYRGRQPAEKHLGIFALYVMFYPQLVAGPIERPQNLLHQFHEPHSFDYERIRSGLVLMAWGLFKKVVIADRLSVLVDIVYGRPTEFTGLPLLIATVFFSIQIYCDFSGYSDIARGAARVMGFQLMENFRSPYFASSIPEFWGRWHISLSTWFRDYVYIPLGGNRVHKLRWIFNLFITFVLSGLWHGANWTFVAWGALHGAFVVASHLLGLTERQTGARRLIGMAITYTAVTIAWVFFRADHISDALYILSHFHQNVTDPLMTFLPRIGFMRIDWILSALSVVLMFMVEGLQLKTDVPGAVFRQSAPVRWAVYAGVLFVVVVFGVFRGTQFIYFQF